MRATQTMNAEEVVEKSDRTLHVIMSSNLGKVRYSVEAAHLQFLTAIRKICPGNPADYRPALP
jgi:hypothetical protein